MSDSDSPFASFGKLVPGFDFLQNLTRQAAGSAAQSLPNVPQLTSWVAPTVSVEEIEKRIQELKSVQFWLDQNATALKATVQALEVQKMTLATLKSMNVAMGDVANAFTFKPGEARQDEAKSGNAKTGDAQPGESRAGSQSPHTFAGLEVPPTTFGSGSSSAAIAKPEPEAQAASASSAPSPIDPLQWWGALTQQFQTIAADAMKEVAKKAAINTSLSGHRTPVSPKSDSTPLEDAMKSATGAATEMAKNMQVGMTKALTGQFDVSPAPRSRSAGTALHTGSAWPTPTASSPKSGATKSAASGRRAKAGTQAGKSAAKTPSKTASKKSAIARASGTGRK
jgi:hypothetical protein